MNKQLDLFEHNNVDQDGLEKVSLTMDEIVEVYTKLQIEYASRQFYMIGLINTLSAHDLMQGLVEIYNDKKKRN